MRILQELKIPMTAAWILIIEDERIGAEVLRLALIKIGYETAGSTATGEDAARFTRGQS
jgi:CheY-like chemotaxis protein